MGAGGETDEGLARVIAARGGSADAARAARDACRELHDRHARKLLAFLAGRVNSGAAEDVAQDVWQKVWHTLPTAFHGGNFRAWLYAVARNCATDHLRRKRAESLTGEGSLADHRHRPADEELAEAELRVALARCLEQLDAQLAEVVRSRLSGESYDEYCARAGVPLDAAYRAFHQAKAQLQACVGKKVGR